MTAPAGPAGAIWADVARTAVVLHAELQRALAILTGDPADAVAPDDVDATTLELTVEGWRHLVPPDPARRRALAELVAGHCGDTLGPRAAVAVGLAPGAHPPVASAASALERVDLPGGHVLFRQGDPGDSMYVISRGRLRVTAHTGGEDAVLRELGPGQTVGETALLTGEARQGTVVAVRDSVVYRLTLEGFEQCRRTHPAVTHGLLLTLARWMSSPPSRGPAGAVTRNLAVLPAGEDAPIREFADALARFLSTHRATTVVTASALEAAVGAGAVDAEPSSSLGVRAQEHLTAVEERHDLVVYVAEAGGSPWASTCARQADVVLLVGRAGAPARLNPLEERLFDPAVHLGAARRHLVLVERDVRSTPTGTAAWLAGRDVEHCHHLHLDAPAHFARLARFLVGAPVGLVLSGGAARAFAHVGVLRALEEAGIPVDIVAATSAGAVIGGQFAMGWDLHQLEHRNRELFGGSRRKLLDLTPPFTALIGATRFNAVLDEIFGDVRFEDLWLPFMCTTTDLTAAEGRTHRRGELRPFVRASCSLPMVMPPVSLHGHLLADGGITNNIPVDPLLAVSPVGTLLVVNVTNAFYTADEAYNYVDSLPLRRILNSRLNPFAERLVAPGILDVLMRALELGSKSLEPAQIAKADVYVRPDVARFGYTDVDQLPDIAAAGHAAAAARLAEWATPRIPFT